MHNTSPRTGCRVLGGRVREQPLGYWWIAAWLQWFQQFLALTGCSNKITLGQVTGWCMLVPQLVKLYGMLRWTLWIGNVFFLLFFSDLLCLSLRFKPFQLERHGASTLLTDLLPPKPKLVSREIMNTIDEVISLFVCSYNRQGPIASHSPQV